MVRTALPVLAQPNQFTSAACLRHADESVSDKTQRKDHERYDLSAMSR